MLQMMMVSSTVANMAEILRIDFTEKQSIFFDGNRISSEKNCGGFMDSALTVYRGRSIAFLREFLSS